MNVRHASMALLAGLLSMVPLHAAAIPIAADAPLPIHRIPLDGALVQNTVTDMLQDRSGLMWFGTLGGLNVYDGYSFRELVVDPDDPHGLSGAQVARLFEDRDGFIWVAGATGVVDRIDPRSGLVQRYPAHLFGVDPGVAGVAAFHQQPDGTLWLGSAGGLHRLRPGSTRFEHGVVRDAGEALAVVRDIEAAGTDALWIAAGRELVRMDTATGELRRFRHDADDPTTLTPGALTALHVDPDGVLWVGGNGGLARMEADGSFTRFRHDPADPRSLGGNQVLAILRSSEGDLWIGSQSGGLSRYRNGGFDVFRSNPDDPGSLSVDDVWSLYEDRSGLIWIGTAGGGLNQINPARQRFRALRSVPHQPDSLRSGFVWDIAEDSGGRLWMATLAGVERHDPGNGSYRLFEPQPGDIGANQLQAVHIDRAGRVFVGAVDGNLYRFDPASGRFAALHDPQRPDLPFAPGRVWHLGQGPDGRLWVGRANDLVALDTESLAIVDRIGLGVDPRAGAVPMRTSLVDSDGALWFGGVGGLLRIASDGTRARIAPDPALPQSLGPAPVRALHEDARGTLWVGAQDGLYRMEADDRRAARNQFAQFTRAQGLANDTIYGILPGKAGTLWLSSNRGLSHFDPATGAVRNFNTSDGLVSNEMNGGAELVGSDGTLYFGGLTGVAAFKPDDIVRNRHVPTVGITRVEIGGKPSSTGVPTDQPLRLGHHSGELLLEFAAMDFHEPEKNRFRYRLEGASPDWIETSRHSVSLAGLAPGDYRFEVQGSNGDGIWSARPATLVIAVAPAPWRSPAAYASYALLLLGMLVLYHRALRNKLRREREFNERLASAHSLAEANHQMALRNAQYDHLTQLPNRSTLTDAIQRYQRLARDQHAAVVLLLINIDRFQRLNDTLGHRLGDHLLKATGERLQAVTRNEDIVARVGGDEFALLTLRPAGADGQAWLHAFGERIAAAIAEPHCQSEPPLRLTASIGVAECAAGSELPAAELMSFANIAMHASKREGGNALRRYEPGMLESARERLDIEGRMRSALAAGEFAAHYQPLIALRSGELAGFEALVRWFPPDAKPIYPDQFIPVAEESGFIVELGDWMIGEVCRQIARWNRPGIRVAVNVSMRQLRSGRLVDTIREALAATGVAATALKLEITESAMMQDVEHVSAQLREISALGVAIAIDDFGTGFSSLSHLRMLPVDEMKIDRSFVTDLASSERNRTIVSSIVRLAHELDIAVVAEGVEDASSLAYLHSVGCDLAQGYLFDRPQAASSVRFEGWDQYATRWFRSAPRASA